MFQAQRQSRLASIHWKPELSGSIYFIESTDEETTRLRHGSLKDAEIHDWVLANVSLYARIKKLPKLRQGSPSSKSRLHEEASWGGFAFFSARDQVCKMETSIVTPHRLENYT